MSHLQQVEISDLQFPERPADGHKGTFGRVLVIAGSVGMSGAACLTATAALRGGAGLVFVATPQSVQPIVAGFEPSYLTTALPCSSDGALSAVSPTLIAELLDGKDAVGLGPGLGQSNHAANLVLSVIEAAQCPLVADADALNLLAEAEVLQGLDKAATAPKSPLSPNSELVVTPHPGEFARMSGLSISEVNDQRQQVAAEFSRLNGVITVLKGAGTVVTDGQRVFINPTGNSGMATGGCGDVLTGLLTAVIGQGIPAFAAACLSVYIHGLAADLAIQDVSQRGLIASDLLRYLGPAWLQWQESGSGG